MKSKNTLNNLPISKKAASKIVFADVRHFSRKNDLRDTYDAV